MQVSVARIAVRTAQQAVVTNGISATSHVLEVEAAVMVGGGKLVIFTERSPLGDFLTDVPPALRVWPGTT